MTTDVDPEVSRTGGGTSRGAIDEKIVDAEVVNRREQPLTIRQDRFVDAIVAGADTNAEAGRAAGWSNHPPTLYPQVSRTASLPKVQREIGIRRAQRGDRAREIFDSCSDVLVRRVRDPEVPDQTVIAAMKVSADVIASGIEEPIDTGAEYSDAFRKRLAFRMAFRFARNLLKYAKENGENGLEAAEARVAGFAALLDEHYPISIALAPPQGFTTSYQAPLQTVFQRRGQ